MRVQEKWSEGADAADAALKAVPAKHLSRTLVERLILDGAAWPSLYNEWRKLFDNKANWEDLAALLAKDGADKVKAELERIGLTFGAAGAVVSLIQKTVPSSMYLISSICSSTLPASAYHRAQQFRRMLCRPTAVCFRRFEVDLCTSIRPKTTPPH